MSKALSTAGTQKMLANFIINKTLRKGLEGKCLDERKAREDRFGGDHHCQSGAETRHKDVGDKKVAIVRGETGRSHLCSSTG